jgi:hypothetical protein
MDITTRNFFRLLRAGEFGQQELVEPMSACKWRKTMLFAKAHGVEAETYAGLEVLNEQFFIQMIPEEVTTEWASLASYNSRRTTLVCTALSPKLEKRLASIAEKADSSSAEYQLLEELLRLAYGMLRDDHWVRQMLVVGEMIRERGSQVNREKLSRWIDKFHLQKMIQLEGALLIELMGLQSDELPFTVKPSEFNIERFASSNPHSQEQMRFSQGKDIFVHTSNKSAIVWNARRSARFLRYYPTESIANLFASFVKSLNNIEE